MKEIIKKSVPKPLFDALKSLRSALRGAKRSLKTKTTSKTLASDLRKAGIRAGDVLMVHSSLRRIGNVEGGAEAVIESLKEVLTADGTLLMPVYGDTRTVFESFHEGRFADLRTQVSLAGKVTEVFRTSKGVFRSSHPYSSICAWGKHAAYITSGHDAASGVCHKDSPIGRLYELNGKVMGLGTDLAHVSFYHLVEETWDRFPFDPYLPEEQMTYIDGEGRTIRRAIRRYDPKISGTRIETEPGRWVLGYFGRELSKHGVLKKFKYGEGESWVMSTHLLYDFLKAQALKGVTIYTTKEQGEKLI